METGLVDGRECGSCNVCCVTPTIDVPDLQKLPGYPCHNARPTGACDIHPTRPDICRAFFCGWRRLRWVGEGLRPDRSGVFVRLVREATAVKGFARSAVTFTLRDAEALEAPGLAEAVAAAIHADIGAFLVVPGPPGYTSSRVRLNETLADAVARRDKPALLRQLAELRAAPVPEGAYRPVILSVHRPRPALLPEHAPAPPD